MKMLLSKVRRIISGFWMPRPKIDYLELSYETMDRHVDEINEEELGKLMAQRDALRRKKKKHSHIQKQIEQVKAKQILNHMRAK